MLSKKNRRHPRKYFEKRPCFWCKKKVIECDKETCQCVYCTFDDQLDKVGIEHPKYVTWVKNNVKFYNILFNEGILLENELRSKWRKKQLKRMEKTGNTMKGWYADLDEVDGKNRIVPNSSDGREILHPFYGEGNNKDKPLKYNYHCQLCGADINDQYFLKHSTKNICIPVGHECASAFHFADEVVGSIKHHMVDLVREEFRKKKPIMKKAILKLLESNHSEKKELKVFLRIVTNYGRKKKTIPITEQLAGIFVKLEGLGVKIFQ